MNVGFRQNLAKYTLRNAVSSPIFSMLGQRKFNPPAVKMSTNSGKRPRTESGGLSPPFAKRKQPSSINQQVVASFFKPTSEKKKEPEKISWRTIDDSLLIGKYQTSGTEVSVTKMPIKRKIAAFDFDGTIISTASGLRFGRDATDWKWWHSSVPSKLRSLYDEGFLLLILSNQAGIALKSGTGNMKRLTDLKRKATAVFTQLDLPMTIYAATTHDQYRKPRTGMWARMRQDFELKPDDIDYENSIFVGDAGGRVENGKLKKDFSCSDRNFSHNVGIAFKTPEEFFLKEEPRAFLRDFDPAQYLSTLEEHNVANASAPMFAKTNDLDIVLFCGSPGAGKSTLYWNVLKPLGYERVNQDILKTRERCLKAAGEFIQEEKSAVVDNTNADPETRESWVKLARKLDVPIRCVLFTASASLCMHNDAVRALNAEAEGINPEKRAMLPKVAFTGFASRYKEPELKEGFQDIFKVDFTFQGTEEQRAIWSKFWT